MSASEQQPATGGPARHGLPELIAERRAKGERVRASDPDAFPYAFAGAEPIEADASDDRREPPALILDHRSVRPADAQPRFLHSVVRLLLRSEHPVRQRP